MASSTYQTLRHLTKFFNLKTCSGLLKGAEEKAQQLRACTVLPEDPSRSPEPVLGNLQLRNSESRENLTPGRLRAPALTSHTYTQTDMYIYIIKIGKVNLQK